MIQIKELSEFQLANNFIFRVLYIFDTLYTHSYASTCVRMRHGLIGCDPLRYHFLV